MSQVSLKTAENKVFCMLSYHILLQTEFLEEPYKNSHDTEESNSHTNTCHGLAGWTTNVQLD